MKKLGAGRWLALSGAAMLLALTFARASAAVSISSFTAKAQTTTILVQWATASELNNAGFYISRSTSLGGPFTQLNSSLIPTNNPGGIMGSSYSYTDNNAQKGQTYYYKLRSVEFSGTPQDFGPVNAVIAAPATATPTSPPPTATFVPPTATKTLVPTALPTATNTPIPSATSSVSPVPSGIPLAPGAASPTPAVKVAQPRASTTPDAGTAADNSDSPTPGATLVALGIDQSTPESDANSSPAATNNPVDTAPAARAYYLSRLVDTTVLLTVGTLLFGSFVLGALAVYFLLRALLR